MTYSRNDVFVWTKYGEKKSYRLVLHCGSPQYFDQLKEIELPWNSLIGELEVEDGYDKSIPFGIRTACTTKLKFDILALKKAGYGDVWNWLRSNSKDVSYREWEGVDTEKYLVNDFRMVNCFVLQYWDETWSEWRNENVFVQSPVSESTIKVESGKSTFEIELYSIHKYCMEKINFQFFNPIWWYDKENYLQPHVRALMGFVADGEELDYSSRRFALRNSGEKKYWCILNNLQTTMNNNQTFIKHSFHIQDARTGSGQMFHLRLMPMKNVFKIMNFAFYNIIRLITRCGKVFTESQMRNFGFPNPIFGGNYKFFKPTHTDDNTHNTQIESNKLFITESIYKAITDGTAPAKYMDAECQYFSNPLYSKFSNAWNFFVEFYSSYNCHVDFNPKTCKFDMRTLFFNNSNRDIISSEIQSENLEYQKLNDCYNDYLMKANVCSTNSNSNVVLKQSTSDSGKKVQSTQYFNTWNDKCQEYYYWNNRENTQYIHDTRTIYNEKNIGSFPVGKIVYRHTDYNIDVFDGIQKQLFICPSHHVENFYIDIPQTYNAVNGVVNSESDLYRWLDQTNSNGFTAYSNQLLSNYLLNKGESAILKFKSNEFFSLTDIGLPFGIRMNDLFKEFVDLPIDSKDYRYCYVTNIKKNYSTDKSEITIFIRGDEYQNL